MNVCELLFLHIVQPPEGKNRIELEPGSKKVLGSPFDINVAHLLSKDVFLIEDDVLNIPDDDS